MEYRIAIAETHDELSRCYPVMRELRPEMASAEDFAERVKRQATQGYRVAYLESDKVVRAVAGYRYLETLFSGRMLCVDDLVTGEGDRSSGFGGILFDWLIVQARAHNCATLELDSGVQRFRAHRFYLRKGMDITSHHFRLPL